MADIPAEVKTLKDKMLQKQYFVMTRKMIDPGKLVPVLLDHYRWMIALEKQGKVFASGPMFEKDGQQGVGMTVFRVDSWEEAEQLAGADPFCEAGAVGFDIQRWQVNEGRVNISIDFSDQTYSMS